jgi:uncharacterized membrane-anchored protein
MTRVLTIAGGLLLILGVTNVQVARQERLLAAGRPMLLALAPVDPRSLIQGDYMVLDYAIERAPGVDRNPDWPRDGALVVRDDERGVAQYVRRHDAGTGLASGERLLAYRVRNGSLRVGTDAFFFQEGHADVYAPARFGELRVDDAGRSLLVGLRDAELRPLVPPTPALPTFER